MELNSTAGSKHNIDEYSNTTFMWKIPIITTSYKRAHTSYPVISQILLHGCIEGGDSILISA